MKTLSRILALLLVFAICLGMAACGQQPSGESYSSSEESAAESAAESSSVSSESSEAEPTDEPADEEKTLVVACDTLSGRFSPFYAVTANDRDVVSMTSLGLLTTDRAGGVVYNAIEGETVEYNGTAYEYTGLSDISVSLNDDGSAVYQIRIRDDVVFSDGVPMTIDDVIFTYYVLCDPSYTGSSAVSSCPIVGLQDYRTQTTSELYEEYSAIVADIYSAGEDYTLTGDESFTEEQYSRFWELLAEQWRNDLCLTADYIADSYGSYIKFIGGTEEDLGDEGWRMALLAFAWDYGDVSDDLVLTLPTTGASFNLSENRPSVDDLYAEVYARYEGSVEDYFNAEQSDYSVDILAAAADKAVSELASGEEELADGIPSISGISRIDDYTLEITTSSFCASDIYTLCGITVAPLHYYGDTEKYDYENNSFGFDFGDLSTVEAKSSAPLGAGAYRFVEYANGVVRFEANESCFRGEPTIDSVEFRQTDSSEMIYPLKNGDADICSLSGSAAELAEIRACNDSGELSGSVLTTVSVADPEYSYIGINADTVLVGEDSSSEESRSLRKALAAVISVCRDAAVESCCGDTAEVINYPMSSDSWASPQKSDEDYRIAYSADIDGNDIYTSDMDADARLAAAIDAAVGYLKAAGYTFDESSGSFTAAPDGASLEYEALVSSDEADGASLAVLNKASEALGGIGITLTVTELGDSDELWDILEEGGQQLWAASWDCGIDPDMYSVYHSDSVAGEGGSGSNYFRIDDEELDQLILDGRDSSDLSYRRSVYLAALDIIMDWAVEIPVCQYRDVCLFSTERINIDSLTPDITARYGWMNGIELLEMN